MSRAATANTLANSGTGRRLESWGDQVAHLQSMQTDLQGKIEALKMSQAQSAEQMAELMLPLAEAMARLTEETRQTLTSVVTQSRKGHETALASVQETSTALRKVSLDAHASMIQVRDQIAELHMARNNQPRPQSPWLPAFLFSLVPTLAVLWLAWKLGAVHM